jgi:hypothetical protein
MTRIKIQLVHTNYGMLSGLLAIRVGFPTQAIISNDDIAFIIQSCLKVRKIYPTIQAVLIDGREEPFNEYNERSISQVITILSENNFLPIAYYRVEHGGIWMLTAKNRVVQGKDWSNFTMLSVSAAIVEGNKLPDLGPVNKGKTVFFTDKEPSNLTGMSDCLVGIYKEDTILEDLYEC